MKKPTLLIAFIALCLNIFAQEKPCTFIGIYAEKKGVCSDKRYEHEDVKDEAEFKIRETKFKEDHKDVERHAVFIPAEQCVIVYSFKKQMSGQTCNPTVYNYSYGKTIEYCKKQIADNQKANAANFKTSPETVYTRTATGLTAKELTEDFDGVTAKISLIKKSNGTEFIFARLTNTTKDKLAMVLIQKDDGEIVREYINPGASFNHSYDGKQVAIQVLYQGFDEPRPEFSVIKFLQKHLLKEFKKENGIIKVKEKGVLEGAIGVRG